MRHISFLAGIGCYGLVGSALLVISCGYQLPDVDQTHATGGSGGMTSSSSGSSSSGTQVDSCGNGFKGADEQCDDGNLRPGDGCSLACTIEDHDGCGVPVLVLKPNEPVVISSTTENAVDDIQRSVAMPCAADDRFGPDLIYAVTPTTPGQLTATMVAQFDTHYLHIRTDCPGMDSSEIACDYGYMASKPDIAIISLQVGVVYYVIADGHGGVGGKFTLTLTLSP